MVRKAAISESFLAQVWQQQAAGREPMVTAGGDTVEVLYPGRPTNDCGPDFRDALIAFNGSTPTKGDVELHIDARDWQAHGHHRDPNYDRVILHVALRSGGAERSRLSSGRYIPVLALSQTLDVASQEWGHGLCQPPFGEQPCYQAFLRHGEESVMRLAEQAGDERFRRKARGFAAALANEDPDQVLYAGLMRSFGYSQNKEPFTRLARLLPVKALEEAARRGDHLRIQALLLGTAGLLPLQRRLIDTEHTGDSDNGAEELQRIWARYGGRQAMSISDWRFHGVRPENSPTRRIVAASHLLTRFQGRPLKAALSLLDRLPLAEVQENMEESLRVHVSGYWASHTDFGAASGWRPALIGRSRARDMIVNVILPFCFSWADASDQGWLRDICLSLYENHPEAEENWIIRHMKARLFGDGTMKMGSARRQQGLIELYEVFCSAHACHECPLGGGRAARHGQPPSAGDLLDTEGAEQLQQRR
ncbi:MAG: DUF2851 family protein [Dehalococcoidia bacterium]|nr:DUF2851 family protein [Dehalococcoidia bacterium]